MQVLAGGECGGAETEDEPGVAQTDGVGVGARLPHQLAEELVAQLDALDAHAHDVLDDRHHVLRTQLLAHQAGQLLKQHAIR